MASGKPFTRDHVVALLLCIKHLEGNMTQASKFAVEIGVEPSIRQAQKTFQVPNQIATKLIPMMKAGRKITPEDLESDDDDTTATTTSKKRTKAQCATKVQKKSRKTSKDKSPINRIDSATEEYHSAPQTPVELAKVSNKEKVDAAVDRAELDDDHEGAAIAADIETIKNKAQETDEANEFVDDDVIAGGETIAEEAFDA